MIRLSLVLSLVACSPEPTVDPSTDTPSDDPVYSALCDTVVAQDRSSDSHDKGADLDYDLVFDDAAVRRIDIVICPDDFAFIEDEVEGLYGGGGRPGQATADPSYVPAHVVYEGRSWPMVGMRYKGNSSLRDAVRSGNGKKPFRLHFDKFEDEVPEVDDQRFWGFKELKFGSAFKDESLIRDKLTSDTYRDAGIPAAKGAFVRVHVDVGDGPVYWGLYTMFEDPSNSLLDDWFGSDDGNCYKPEGVGAALDVWDQESMQKCSNEDAEDYRDVQELVRVLGSEQSGDAWRAELRQVLAADDYMATLAMGGLVKNWDVYGVMTHNYYLYADPGNGDRLTWIPWDFNEAYRTDGVRTPLSIELDEVDDRWPLIRRTMDDPELRTVYHEALQQQLDGPFDRDVQRERAQRYHDLVAPWVVGEHGEQPGYTYLAGDAPFEGSVDDLMDQVDAARAEAEAALR